MKRIGLLITIIAALMLFTSCISSQYTAVNDKFGNTTTGKVFIPNYERDKNASGSAQINSGLEDKGETESSKQNNSISNSVQNNGDLERERFDKLVEKYVTGINNRDLDLIFQCIDKQSDGWYGPDTTKGILDDYVMYFKDSNSIKYRFIEHVQNGTHPIYQIYYYELYDSSGKTIKVQAVKRDKDEFIESIPINYSYVVHRSIAGYVDSIKSKNLKRLAIFFQLEGTEDIYPESNVIKIIEKYSAAFDLSTMKYRFKDINKNEYIYDIYGVKDGKESTHQIKIICGNGLCGVLDEWVPLIQ